jgi:hypothetical protein
MLRAMLQKHARLTVQKIGLRSASAVFLILLVFPQAETKTLTQLISTSLR